MPRFYYTQTVTYTLQVTADSEAAADEIAAETTVDSLGVVASSTGWEEDGYDDE